MDSIIRHPKIPDCKTLRYAEIFNFLIDFRFEFNTIFFQFDTITQTIDSHQKKFEFIYRTWKDSMIIIYNNFYNFDVKVHLKIIQTSIVNIFFIKISLLVMPFEVPDLDHKFLFEFYFLYNQPEFSPLLRLILAGIFPQIQPIQIF